MKKIGDITHHKSGIVVPYYLDGTTFTCLCLEQRLTAPEAKMIEAMVQDRIEHWLTLEWYPVIVVEFSDYDGWGNSRKTGLWLQTDRMLLSRSPAGAILQCEWDAEPAHRKALARGDAEDRLRLTCLPLGAPLKVQKGKVWLDYTEQKWAALTEIRRGVEALSAAVAQVVSTSAGNDRLENCTLPMLLAPSPDETPVPLLQ